MRVGGEVENPGRWLHIVSMGRSQYAAFRHMITPVFRLAHSGRLELSILSEFTEPSRKVLSPFVGFAVCIMYCTRECGPCPSNTDGARFAPRVVLAAWWRRSSHLTLISFYNFPLNRLEYAVGYCTLCSFGTCSVLA
jgi:hypothetical protein